MIPTDRCMYIIALNALEPSSEVLWNFRAVLRIFVHDKYELRNATYEIDDG